MKRLVFADIFFESRHGSFRRQDMFNFGCGVVSFLAIDTNFLNFSQP